MKTELLLKFLFEASHSLAGYEEPHPHIWRLEVAVGGMPIEGRIVDIVQLRRRIEKLLNPLRLTFLNESLHVSAEVRKFPTCETLSQFFCEELNKILKTDFLKTNPTIYLSFVAVAICDMEQVEMGAVRLILLV